MISKSHLKWIGRILGTLALIAVAASLYREREAIPELAYGPGLVAALALGVLVNLLAVGWGALAWKLLLDEDGRALTNRRSFEICGLSQIGKYLPGNVFHLVGRGSLAVREGIALGAVTSSMGLEILGIVVVGAFVSLPFLWRQQADLVQHLPFAGDGLWIGVGLALSVIVGLTLVVMILARGRLGPHLRRLRPSVVLRVVTYDVLMFVALGTALFAIFRQAWPDAVQLSLFDCISAFALAWVAGFVTPGAPGGLGVREGVFTVLLGPGVGIGTAAALAVIQRLVTVLGDVLTYLVALRSAAGRPAKDVQDAGRDATSR